MGVQKAVPWPAEENATQLPLGAFFGNEEHAVNTRELLILALTPAFNASGLVPSRYSLELETKPDWLRIEPSSGALMVSHMEAPEPPADVKLGFTVRLIFDNIMGREEEDIKCGFVSEGQEKCFRMLGKGSLAAKKLIEKSRSAQFRKVLETRLSTIVDFSRGMPREVSLGVWAQTLADAAMLAAAAATSHLFEKPQGW